MPRYLLAHDLGTSGNKASLFSESGSLIASDTQSYKTVYPASGWSEQNPADWWKAVCDATKRVTARIDSRQIAAIAVTGQMMGTVPMGHSGELLGNSIIWSDSRAGEQCGRLTACLGEDHYYRITGQPPSASYSLPKIMWLKEHLPKQYEETAVYLQAKDYINYCLTGQMATDRTDAAYTMAYDISRRVWSEEILSAAGIDGKKLPPVLGSSEMLGTVTEGAARACGIVPGIPVMVGAGDGSSAHLGAGCVEEGDAYLCLGSSTWIAAQTKSLVFDPLRRMQSEPHVLDGKYCFLGTMQTGGLAHSWARKNLSPTPIDYAQIDSMVGRSPVGAGGILFLPYLMGERSPWYDLDASASFLGVRIESRNEDLYRAVLEGVAMNLNILMNVIREEADINRMVVIGGGARSRAWIQILADVLNVRIAVPRNVEEGTGMGGAIIAGVGCGLFSDYSVSKRFLNIAGEVEPDKKNATYYKERQPVFESAYEALKGIYPRL